MKTAVLIFLVVSALRSGAAPVDDVDALISKGEALSKQFKFRESLAFFLDAEKRDRSNIGILRRIAQAYTLAMPDQSDDGAKRDFGIKALEYAKRAAALDEENATNHLALAICYGRVAPLLDSKTKITFSKLVREHAEAAIKLDATNDLAYFVMGDWNYEIASLNPITRMIASAIYGSMPSASYEGAVEYFKKALSINPERLGSYVELGRTYAAMKQTALATTNLRKGLSMPTREKEDEEEKHRARDALQKL